MCIVLTFIASLCAKADNEITLKYRITLAGRSLIYVLSINMYVKVVSEDAVTIKADVLRNGRKQYLIIGTCYKVFV